MAEEITAGLLTQTWIFPAPGGLWQSRGVPNPSQGGFNPAEVIQRWHRTELWAPRGCVSVSGESRVGSTVPWLVLSPPWGWRVTFRTDVPQGR